MQDSEFDSDIAKVSAIPAVPTILDVVCRITGMGFAAVARVTEDRWIACSVKDDIAFGLAPGGELKVETTICHEIRQSGEAVVINHVAEDPLYKTHHTPRMYGLQSYISMPIVLPDGRFFGTLCAIDPRPAKLDRVEIVGTFKMFAELIAFHLDALDRLAASEAEAELARQNAILRDRFIAVLGHDLRNPLAAIDAGTKLLQRAPSEDKAAEILTLIRATTKRMFGLVDNVLDFARGRMGGGISLVREPSAALEPLLNQIIDELSIAFPGRAIITDIDLNAFVDCDPARIAQLFSNLVANALTHGAKSEPVRVTASVYSDAFEISVSNLGGPILPEVLPRLFLPFFRGEVKENVQGLGLGLFISSEIAKAHGGTLSVSSDERETRFWVRIPKRAPV